MAKTYSAKDITVLEGLEPVRQRPAMYIGGVGKDGYHHLLAEIVDNSVDEAINGHAKRVEVAVSKDRLRASVTDDGRGIPVDDHPQHKVPAVTLILTTLHSGGKFGHESYIHSGGLHGVGSSVVNALSSELEVRVRRDGHEWRQTFARGKPTSKLIKGEKVKGSGTTVSFTPDPDIFGTALHFDLERVRGKLDDLSFVHAGVEFVLVDEATGERTVFKQTGGIAAQLERALGLQKVGRSIPEPFTFSRETKPGEPVSKVELALTWTDATDDHLKSYINGVHTSSGGTHEAGVRAAIVKAVRAWMATHGRAVPPGVKITGEDIREGIRGVLSVFMSDPQFQGQTKHRLNNPEVAPAIESMVWPALEKWLNEHLSLAEAIVGRIVMAARARQASREAASAVRKKGRTGRKGSIPDKLADCSSNDPTECELFVVEGDSAGGSAKQGRDRKTQAVLPLRGKVLNTEALSLAKVLETRELADLVRALGCGVGDAFDPEQLNYSRVILLMDADADGDHITTLLLTFFWRHLPELIRRGHLHVAKPPLFKIELGKEVHWAGNEAERDAILEKHGKGRKATISRFKGLGEMDARVLGETTLDPKKRTLLQVTVSDAEAADTCLRELMGKDTQARFQFIMEEAATLEEVDV